ncbi:MAG: TonB-dependent receptor [Saprospiraceae bacterium]
MRIVFTVLCYCLPFCSLFAQTYTLNGYVTDAVTGEHLGLANIVELKTGKGAISNDYGYYSLSLVSDTVILVCSYVGYQNDTVGLFLTKNSTLPFSLKPISNLIPVEVVGHLSESPEISPRLGVLKLSSTQIQALPSLLGEPDILRGLQLLPGIQSGSEGQTGLFVRGGSPDQNLLLLDGIPVYNAFHLFGFFSVFDADAIKDVTLYKGGFPARFGGRLSSVLDIKMKEGNMKEWHGTATLGLISSKFMIEGPLQKGKTSFMFSARRTYADILAAPFLNRAQKRDGLDQKLSYFFHDLNIKLNHKFSDKDRLFISIYNGLDQYNRKTSLTDLLFEQTNQDQLKWGNQTLALRWNHVWNPRLFSNGVLTYSNFELQTKDAIYTKSEEEAPPLINSFDLDYTSGIRDIAVGLNFDYIPSAQHLLKFGGKFIKHQFNPGIFDQYINIVSPDLNYEQDSILGQEKIYAKEWALYVEDEFRPNQAFSINAGFHFTGYHVENKSHLSIQPRFSIHYTLTEQLSLKAGFATMAQFIHLLTNSSIGLATDLWLPSTTQISPQLGWQTSIGLSQSYQEKYKLTIEGFYKKMKNVSAYKPGVSLFDFNEWQDRILQGKGEAYGAEILLEKPNGRLNGWIGYTLSWSWRQFEGLNEGQRFPFRYDKRHDISVVANYKIKKNISLSSTWVFSTGNALTIPNNRYTGVGPPPGHGTAILLDYGKRNGSRLPAYHRLDVSCAFRKVKKKFVRIWSLGVYNLYARRNPFYIEIDGSANGKGELNKRELKLKKISLPPLIPSIAYKIEF